MHCYTKDELRPVTGNILFLGDSITDDGRYLSFLEAYLRLYAADSGISIQNLGVSSETVSGLSEPDHPFPRPTLHGRLARALEKIEADWVVLCYGINDGIYYPFGEERFAAFQKGYERAIATIRELRPAAGIVVMTPPPFDAQSFAAGGNALLPDGAPKYSYMEAFEGYDQVMARYSEWILTGLSDKADLVIDLRGVMEEDLSLIRKAQPGYLSGDGIHPFEHGHWVMAREILGELFGITEFSGEALFAQDDFAYFHGIHTLSKLRHSRIKEEIGHDNPYKDEVLSEEAFQTALREGEKAVLQLANDCPSLLDRVWEWQGYKTHTLHFEGFEVTVAVPEKAAPGRPWIWRTEFFGAFPSVDLDMLEKGWHVAHVGISHLFGNPLAVSIMSRFHDFIIKRFSLSEKPILFGFSRGGLYAVSYAKAYPLRVKALYLDAPVFDIRSWPGGKGSGCGSPWDYERAKKAFCLTDETIGQFDALMDQTLAALTENRLPMILVAGDSDEVVPFEENGKLLCKAYERAGLELPLILKPGVGHHPHSLTNPSPVSRFLLEAAERGK